MGLLGVATLVQDLSRKSIPGRDANLPPFIIEQMEAQDIQPTLRQLALSSGVKLVTLQENLKGTAAMRLSNAKKLADALKCSVDDLIKEVPTLLQ